MTPNLRPLHPQAGTRIPRDRMQENGEPVRLFLLSLSSSPSRLAYRFIFRYFGVCVSQ